MKVTHYQQMMAYLTRPGYDKGGKVLPKKKPQEEIKRRSRINYEKLKKYLDPESQMFIEKELGFAIGGSVETSKRGLVDEPGSYGGAKDVDKINKIKNYINKQGNKIDAFEFKKFVEELGYKRPRGVIDNLELGLFDNVLGNKTFINKDKRPPKIGFGLSKGQITVLNKYAKLLNSQQPEKYTSANFIELGGKERANILARARANDFKFKATSVFDEFTDTQKQKIIEAFGLEQDAFDFDLSKQKNIKGVSKYGVTRDDKRFNQIKRFVDFGFKFPPKDTLPIAKQREIIARFELPEGFKDWDFKKYKYGVPSGGVNSNPAYTKRIMDFVDGKARYPNLAADAGTPQGWMMNQFYRTYTYEKERNVPKNKLTYKPIFETINDKQKIVGFVDNTVSGNRKTYFGLKKWNNKYGGNLLNTHPDFKNVKKFVDISNRAFVEPNKVIMGLLQKGGLKPNTKIKFNDVLNFLAEKKGYKTTERAIKIHHQSGVGAGGFSGQAVQDLQLLRSEVNSSIRQAETRIRNAVINNLIPNIEDINKLKNLGASIKVGGKIYGAGSQTAIGSFKEIERQAISEIKDFSKKDFKNLFDSLPSAVEKLPKATQVRICRKLAAKNLGGISQDCAVALKQNPTQTAGIVFDETKNLKTKTGVRATGLARELIRLGIGSEIAFLGGEAAIGNIFSGRPFTESLQSTLFMPGRADAARERRADLTTREQMISDAIGLQGKIASLKSQIKASEDVGDEASIPVLEKALKETEAELGSPVDPTDKLQETTLEDLTSPYSATNISRQRKLDNILDADKAKSIASQMTLRDVEQGIPNIADYGEIDSGVSRKVFEPRKTLPADDDFLAKYIRENFLPFLSEKEFSVDPMDPTDKLKSDTIYDVFRKEMTPMDEFLMKGSDPRFAEQIYGTQGKFAGGGIAKLAGKRSGPAPKSGPTPQGLDFLMKRGR